MAGEAAARGHRTEALFTEVGRGRPWLALLEDAQVPVTFVATEDARGRQDAISRAVPPGARALVHTHFSSFDLPALAFARRRDEPTSVIWHIHTRLSDAPLRRLRTTLRFRTAGRRVDRILAVTDQIAEAARRRGALSAQVLTVPNAIDMGRNPARTAEHSATARAQLGAHGRPLLLHFGRDWPLKGGDVLLEAVAMLAARGVSVQVFTVDGGRAAREQAARLGIAGSVRTIDPVENASDLYAAGDVFVLSGRAEGVYSLLEAAACGAGIVASDIPGQAELAARIPGARLCELAPGPLADAIEDVLARDLDTAARDAAAARAWVAEHADVRGAARRMVDLYEEVSRAGR